ncbi:MAG: ATP-binding protein [Acidiferrobacter sp.]
MKLWPETLFGRTALIIALSLIIAQFTFLLLAELTFSHVRVRQIAALVKTEALTIQSAEALMPTDRRAAFESMIRPFGLRFGHTKSSHKATGFFADALSRQLASHHLPAKITAHKKGLGVAVTMNGRPLTIQLPGPPPALPWPRIGFLIIGALLAGTGALLIVRRVNRPLAELAGAAAIFGHGDTPPLLSGDGPIEIRRVSAAFNQMTEDARRYERDRALLLAGVSHDLRTPLARMRLAIELAVSEDPELRWGMIQDIAEMDSILAEFLAYARHGIEEAPVLGQLENLITEIVHRYNRHEGAVSYDATPLPRFAYRPLATGRLIGNLVDNAISHGRPPIHIRTSLEHDFVLISVADRGPGLTDSQCAQLLSAVELNKSGRRGLGLAIARRIAEAHGGGISLARREGGGLEVLVRLPIRKTVLLEGAAGTQAHGL